MPHITVIMTNGQRRQVQAAARGSLMQALRDAAIDDLLAVCGGQRSCATCHVYFDSVERGVLPEMSDEENDLLDGSSHRTSTSRLSCQIPFDDRLEGAVMAIAPLD